MIQKERKRQDKQQAVKRIFWNQLLYSSPAFGPVIESQISFLELTPACRVLDLGCGHGRHLADIARYDVHVIGIDVSQEQIVYAQQSAERLGADFTIVLVQADAQALPFASNTFHAIFGKAILHHIDNLERAAAEISRVLQSGGRAAFAEPMLAHPLFWLARRFTPGLRDSTEKPFMLGNFHQFASSFGGGETEVWFLFAPMAYLFRLLPGGEPIFRKAHKLLCRLDKWLFHHFPFLRYLAWYGTVKVINP